MPTIKNDKIDKQHLLENCDYGLDFYEHVLGELEMAETDRCKNICNPFYHDSNPAFSIFFRNDIWRFHDNGDPSYSGDVFTFAALHFDLDIKYNFGKILHLMYDALGISKPEQEEVVDDIIFETEYLLPGKICDEAGVALAHDYFKEYGISRDVLRQFSVRGIRSYYYVDKKGEIKQWRYRSGQIGIAYEEINHVKLYHPGQKEFKFQYRGHKPQDYVFGQSRIIRDMIKTGKWERDILIIAAGEKDTMTLTGLGYDAICLNSETATSIPLQLEDSIINNYKWIVVLYDLDEAGKRAAKKLQKRHGFKICELPAELNHRGGKDVSDYVKFGLDTQILDRLIKQSAEKMFSQVGRRNEKISVTKIYSGYINNKGELINNILHDGQNYSIASQSVTEKENPGYPENDDPAECHEEETSVEETTAEITSKRFDFVPVLVDAASQSTSTTSFTTTLFSDEIFKNLPKPLNNLCSLFTDKRERDIIFFSCLAMLSSLFPSLKSINDGRIIGANLNLFISAPAASGKGIANWAKKLGESIQRFLREKFKRDLSQYNIDLDLHKQRVRKKEGGEEPKVPLRKSLFIPANNSVSKVYEMLGANQNFGIIFETEGDTLSGALKTEWGNFSDVIRKCFHHETISLARRANDELIEVDNPHLTVFLTGTPEQINGLIQSVENGFFSRFGFYDFESELVWKSQFKKNDNSINAAFQQAAEQFSLIWLRHEGAKDTFVKISPQLISTIDAYFESKLLLLNGIHGNDINASVSRTCVIWQRIAMVLTAMRHLEQNKLLPLELEVSEVDGSIALKIVDTMLSHLQTVFARMKRTSPSVKLNAQQFKVWQSLPQEFDRKDFNIQVEDLEIEYKTGEKYLQDYIKRKMLERIRHGFYSKVN